MSGDGVPHWLTGLFSHYGYFVIVVAVLLENAGVPAPGHTVLLAGGFLAHLHQLSIWWVIASGASAAIVGDNIGYWIGRRRGRRFLERHGRRFLLTEARQRAIDRFFARHGPKAVFFARFITGFQTVAALFAGASRMRWLLFFVYNVFGAVTWATVYAMVGYAFGASWTLLERWIGRAGIGLLGALLLIILVAAILRYRDRLKAVARWLPFTLISRQWLLSLGAIGALGVFAKIAEDVVEHESTPFDRMASLHLHHLDSPFMDVTMRFFTFIGSPPVVALVVASVLVLCYRRHEIRLLITLLLIALVDPLLNTFLKLLFARPRPTLFFEIAGPHSYSFPSGHAMAAAAIYGMAAIVLARLFPAERRALAYGTPVLIALIGVSRIFLGVHWTTDVLAGYAVGIFLLMLGMYGLGPRKGTK